MTTTKLIELLEAHEHGGVTGKSREVSFYINDKYYIPEPIITVSGTGDGVFTTIELNLETDTDVQPVNHGKWKYYKNNGIIDTYICTNCQGKVEMAIDVEPSKFKYCPNCGARMDGDTK